LRLYLSRPACPDTAGSPASAPRTPLDESVNEEEVWRNRHPEGIRPLVPRPDGATHQVADTHPSSAACQFCLTRGSKLHKVGEPRVVAPVRAGCLER
jgi:hypothetical protein